MTNSPALIAWYCAQVLADRAHGVAGELHLGRVLDVEDAREIAVDAQHGAVGRGGSATSSRSSAGAAI